MLVQAASTTAPSPERRQDPHLVPPGFRWRVGLISVLGRRARGIGQLPYLPSPLASRGDDVGVTRRVSSPDLVGRSEQLALLSHALDDAVSGTPRFVVVDGEAGIGKTRL